MNDIYKTDAEFEAKVQEIIKNYLKQGGFTSRKLTDTPTDGLQVVNRNYVTMNGTTANRPSASVIGQSYFDTSLNKPIWWQGTKFVDAQGNVI